jgi:hypothetical protein
MGLAASAESGDSADPSVWMDDGHSVRDAVVDAAASQLGATGVASEFARLAR